MSEEVVYPFGTAPYGEGGESAVFAAAHLTGVGSLRDELLSTSAHLTGASSLSYVVAEQGNNLTGSGTLEGALVVGRTGGSTSTVLVQPEAVGTKVLAGSTAVVLVNALGEGLRIAPYDIHPNTRGATNYLPAGLAALAAQRLNGIEQEEVVPRPTVTRQTWASDVPISRPAAAPSEALVDLGGFAFGPTGIIIPVTDEDVEAMAVPTHEDA